ncbi:unnamed protein product [Arctogadus glacialis]
MCQRVNRSVCREKCGKGKGVVSSPDDPGDEKEGVVDDVDVCGCEDGGKMSGEGVRTKRGYRAEKRERPESPSFQVSSWSSPEQSHSRESESSLTAGSQSPVSQQGVRVQSHSRESESSLTAGSQSPVSQQGVRVQSHSRESESSLTEGSHGLWMKSDSARGYLL